MSCRIEIGDIKFTCLVGHCWLQFVGTNLAPDVPCLSPFSLTRIDCAHLCFRLHLRCPLAIPTPKFHLLTPWRTVIASDLSAGAPVVHVVSTLACIIKFCAKWLTSLIYVNTEHWWCYNCITSLVFPCHWRWMWLVSIIVFKKALHHLDFITLVHLCFVISVLYLVFICFFWFVTCIENYCIICGVLRKTKY